MKNKKKMLLITHGFPFGEFERSFLASEIVQLENRYELTVMAVMQKGEEKEIIYKPSGKYRILKYKYGSTYKMSPLPLLTDGAALKEIFSAIAERGSLKEKLSRVKFISSYCIRSATFGRTLERAVKKYGTETIYTYWCTEELYAAVRLKHKYPNIKVMSRLHRFDLFKFCGIGNVQPMKKYIANNADLLVFVSRDGMNYFKNTFPGKSETLVSYLGTRNFGKIPTHDRDEIVAISCSNVIPVKRVDRIVQAMACLDGVKVKWYHIGDGPELDRIRNEAEKLLSNGNCDAVFLGRIPNDELPELYHRLKPDVFITASESEGLPISMVEAMSCGIPAIAAAVGGIPECITTGSTGWLLQPDPTPEEIATAITELAEMSANQRHEMNNKVYQFYCEYFDASANAVRFIHELEKRNL